MQLNTICNNDCKSGLRQYPENFTHSIVTDPPYEIGLMNRSWDKTGIAYDIEFWKECYRVLRPGGYLLAFSSTRTYHRMACAIEDAGFEIRDKIDYFHDSNEEFKEFIRSLSEKQKIQFAKILEQQGDTGFMSWIYSQGFPKGIDISKSIDSLLGNERKVIGHREHPTLKDKSKVLRNGKNPFNGVNAITDEWNITAPASELSAQWEGWKTALKPANEPICIARKPLSEKTIAENILKWGTGAMNIGANRIGLGTVKTTGHKNGKGNTLGLKDYVSPEDYNGDSHTGRFPANVIFDEQAGQLLNKQSGILKSGSNCIRKKSSTFIEHGGLGKAGDIQMTYGDAGGASRFFYCAKSSKKEKGSYNDHISVKPVSLIKHLVSLVTPVGGISIDPFSGSGTHAISCIELGINFVGFEIDKHYYDICLKRIAEYQKSL